jgi:membrane dipeptidase
MIRKIQMALAALAVAACGGASDAPVEPEQAAVPPAARTPATPAEIHDRLMVLDSHLDTPANFHDHTYSIVADNPTKLGSVQVDLPKMKRGGLDGGFWVIYTPQGPLTPEDYETNYKAAMVRADEIHAIEAEHGADFEIATRASDAIRIVSEGKRVMYISIENSYPLGTDLANVERFYDRGVRLIGPVHFRDNQFADSATDLEIDSHGGLSELGEGLVREANRLGIVLDGSHAGDDAVRDMMDISTTPILLTHTGVKAIYDHPRNIDDELLRELAADGGVIQINAYGGYLEALQPSAERAAAIAALEAEYEGQEFSDMDEATQKEARAKMDVINAEFPAPRSTFEKFMEHMLYALEIVGVEHVGMGADWDGGGGVTGMEDVSLLPKVTERLLAEGYSEADLEKIWSGNMLRLLAVAEAEAAQ